MKNGLINKKIKKLAFGIRKSSNQSMSGVCSLFADKLKLLKLLGTIVAISCASGIVRSEIVLSDAVKTKIRRAVGVYVSDRFYGGVLSGEEKRKENVRFTYMKNLDDQTARSCYEADCGGLFEFFTSIVAPEYAECQQNLGLPDFMKVRAKDVFGSINYGRYGRERSLLYMFRTDISCTCI